MNIRRARAGTLVIVAFVLLVPALSLGLQAESTDDSGTWTLALYVDADCNLEMYWDSPSLPYLKNIPDSDGFNIVAIVDRLSTNTVERIEISYGSSEVVQTYYEEMNFGDGTTFSWFLDEVEKYYSSDYLCVIPWNHGSAWNGFCWDDTSLGDRITLHEMGVAIAEADVYIDILAFDACACSSIELIYQAALTDRVGLLVASEELVAGDGFPYDLMFTDAAEDPSRTPDVVAQDMLDGWIASYEPIPWAWYCSLGIVDVTEISRSTDVIKTWVEEMTDGLPDYIPNYRVALRDSYYVSAGSHYQVDMVDLGRHLLDDDALSGDVELMDATQAMVDLIEGAVKGIYNTETTAAAGGVSIYWGSHNTLWRDGMDRYMALDFSVDSGWGEFLFQYNALTCGWMSITK